MNSITVPPRLLSNVLKLVWLSFGPDEMDLAGVLNCSFFFIFYYMFQNEFYQLMDGGLISVTISSVNQKMKWVGGDKVISNMCDATMCHQMAASTKQSVKGLTCKCRLWSITLSLLFNIFLPEKKKNTEHRERQKLCYSCRLSFLYLTEYYGTNWEFSVVTVVEEAKEEVNVLNIAKGQGKTDKNKSGRNRKGMCVCVCVCVWPLNDWAAVFHHNLASNIYIQRKWKP